MYEFGFGLSYSKFEIGEVKVGNETLNVTRLAEGEIQPGGKGGLWETVMSVSAEVRNTGKTAGATVVQLYLAFPQDGVPEGTPLRVLRGFEKVMLQPGATETVELALKRRDMSYWDVVSQEWMIPRGTFNVHVGFSSRDFQRNSTIIVS